MQLGVTAGNGFTIAWQSDRHYLSVDMDRLGRVTRGERRHHGRLSAPGGLAAPCSTVGLRRDRSAGPACQIEAELRARHADDPLPADDATLARMISALLAYHGRMAGRFYGQTVLGMRSSKSTDGHLEIQYAPMRAAPDGSRTRTPTACPFCVSPEAQRRSVKWRDVIVLPNRYPYFPLAREHIVIASAEHLPQGTSEEHLQTMLDFQALARDGRPLTLFYNGNVGNSQFHRHWQGCRVVPPLARLLDTGELATRCWFETSHGKVESFDQRNLRGLLVRGTPRFVSQTGARIAAALETEPTTRGRYHLMLLPCKQSEARLAVFPRRAERCERSVPGVPSLHLAGWDMGGSILVQTASLPNGMTETQLAAAVTASIRDTVVPAEDLADVIRGVALLHGCSSRVC